CENLNGTDFVPRLLAQCSRPLRVFLVGARPAVVERALRRLAETYPQHRWLGCQHGYYAHDAEAALCARIRDLAPDLLLVALGNPLQEQWIVRCGAATGATVCMGVGALFDFVGGEVRRAPAWVRRLRCEWIYRLLQEPGRLWRRYLIGNVSFLWAARGDAT
ncbi:MAG: WecB/TagA/CpsF family glycosyltransferase, partial [Rhodocyclaceae bacterium]|nr:WecB/TagA/CpsF family glycosyltransferase [Rhodocyclaceae bacterium]